MSREDLLDRLRAEGRDHVAAIATDRDQRLAEIARRRDEDIDRLEHEQRSRTARASATIRERSMSRARMERRKVLLAARWEVIERVFETAKERVAEGEEYRRLMRRIVDRYATGDGVVVRVSARDRERLGRGLGVRFGDPAPISGGILIQAGGRTLDFSLDEGIAAIRGELAAELSRQLFPQDDRTTR